MENFIYFKPIKKIFSIEELPKKRQLCIEKSVHRPFHESSSGTSWVLNGGPVPGLKYAFLAPSGVKYMTSSCVSLCPSMGPRMNQAYGVSGRTNTLTSNS